MSDTLSSKEAAELLGVTPATVWKWVRDGHLRATLLTRKRRIQIQREDLERFAATHYYGVRQREADNVAQDS